MGVAGAVRTWGSTADERAERYECDDVLPEADDEVFRAISIAAPASTVYRWLCQMRVAPYSYDLLDNLGRRSPQTLTPGLGELEVGQRIAVIFAVTSFTGNEQITMRTTNGIFGDCAITYRVRPMSESTSRLTVKLLVRYPRGPVGWLGRAVLPAGDLVMMRRQLLNFRDLAEGRK